MNDPVVFDTVTLLQGVTNPSGPAGACFEMVQKGTVALVLSATGIEELRDVLTREKIRRRFPSLTPQMVEQFLEALAAKATLMASVPEDFKFPRDPDDEPILNLAIASQAACLVTRDKHLLDLVREDLPEAKAFREKHPSLKMVDPVAFLGLCRRSPSGTA